MVIDFLTQVSTAQVLAAGTVTSTSSIPLSAGLGVRSDDIVFEFNVSGVSGTTPTLQVDVVGADDQGLTTNVVPIGSTSPVIASGQVAKTYYARGMLLTKKAYVGLRYTMGGTTPAATVTAAVCGVDGTAVKQADYWQS